MDGRKREGETGDEIAFLPKDFGVFFDFFLCLGGDGGGDGGVIISTIHFARLDKVLIISFTPVRETLLQEAFFLPHL